MRSVRWSSITLIGLILYFIALLAGCNPGQQPPSKVETPSGTTVPGPTETPTASTPGGDTPTVSPTRTMEIEFAQDRLIVIGLSHPITDSEGVTISHEITTCVESALGQSRQLQSAISLGQMLSNDNITSTEIIFPPALRPALALGIVDLAKGSDVRAAVNSINSLSLITCPVRADPDYVLGYPWSIEPASINHPGQANPNQPNAADLWWRDSNPGINKTGYTGPRKGSNVTVGIFDSATPLSSGGNKIPISAVGGASWLLTVERSASWGGLPPSSVVTPVQSHGLFVSSLVHDVSPDADLRLYEVLNREAKGYLSTLLWATYDFYNAFTLGGTVTRPVVVNFSLGIPTDVNGNPPGSPTPPWTPDAMIVGMNAAGMILVASAGNDIGQSQAYPANDPRVVGVAANGSSAGLPVRGCFSNDGDIFAPGGQAVTTSPCSNTPNPALTCATSPGNCVVGVEKSPGAANYDFAYWAGTSFSTPIVSGVLANMYERWKANGKPLGSDAPTELRNTLQNSAVSTTVGLLAEMDVSIGAVECPNPPCGP